MGVVIHRAKSPGAAANWGISTGLVRSDRATVVAIPSDKDTESLKPYLDRLLNKRECESVSLILGTVLKHITK
jgi:hypothetical protein